MAALVACQRHGQTLDTAVSRPHQLPTGAWLGHTDNSRVEPGHRACVPIGGKLRISASELLEFDARRFQSL